MSNEQTIKRLEDRSFKARIGIGELCAQAGVAASTFSRWKKKPSSMRPKTVAKLEAKLDEIEQQRKAKS